jgi:hypothetical protein
LKAKKVGWISGSASTGARDIGGCAIAYPPYISPEFLVFYDRLSGVRYKKNETIQLGTIKPPLEVKRGLGELRLPPGLACNIQARR